MKEHKVTPYLENVTGKFNIRPFALNGADGASATVNLSLEGNNTLKSVVLLQAVYRP